MAREKNRLPLKVLWIDQEAEWQGTVDYCTSVFENPDIEPMWFQMPMVITNNASSFNRYSYCWKEGEDWIHPKHPLSKKENNYGTDRFHELFGAIFNKEFHNQKTCYLSGVRTEEAPKRFVALTYALTYKWITWGKVLSKQQEHYTFYPVYDWSFTDIWKFIQNNGIRYNKVYDAMYQHGTKISDMRISNVHHETAIQSLMLVQELEPETWNKVAHRIDGANTIKHIKTNSFKCPKEYPPMFKDWEEYGLYLAENIIQEEKYQKMLLKEVERMKKIYTDDLIRNTMWQQVINTILSSDWDFTKLKNWEIKSDVHTYRNIKLGRPVSFNMGNNERNFRFLTTEMKDFLIQTLYNGIQKDDSGSV